MLKKFQNQTKHLIPQNAKILVALSGGADSVALLHLFYNSGYDIAAAHCNFQLRDNESIKDAELARQTAGELNIPYFEIKFDTRKFADEHKYSIEEAARILRYDWFETVRNKHNYDFIATAHHADDHIETFFIKLTAGTGMRGLTGIKAVNGKILRPLLFASKQDILDYCKKNQIAYRTDKSNFDTDFTRNNFRHNILPMFKEINPSFSKTMLRNLDILSDIEKIYLDSIKNHRQKCISENGNFIKINIKNLLQTPAPKTFLYEFLRPYKFNSAVISDMFKNLNGQSGKLFYAENHRALIDRNTLIISNLKKEKHQNIKLNEDDRELKMPVNLSIKYYENNANFKLKKSTNIAYFDADKLQFPLIIRSYEAGDSFQPFGMKGKQKLSDFFTNQKYNLFEKEDALVLCSGKDIIWIIGKRTDERYKITKHTKRICEIKRRPKIL